MKTNKYAVMMGFRYHQDKKDFLNKAYGERLPNLLREACDQLILRAIEGDTKNK